MESYNHTERKNKRWNNYRAIRHTFGQNIAKSTICLGSFQTEQEAQAAVLRDQLRMMNIGWDFEGMEGLRNIHGFKDYCHYEIEG